MDKFTINENCINCKACVRVSDLNFKIEGEKAVVFKQPENEVEVEKCNSALSVCPTNAIEILKPEVILGETKVRETLEKHPHLKERLLELSPKFKTMQNPVMWNTVARFATFKDTEKMTGVSLCEILHFINKELGIEDLLSAEFPNCIKEVDTIELTNSKVITWKEPKVIFKVEDSKTEEIIELVKKVEELKEGESLVFESNSLLRPLVKIIEDMKLSYNLVRINPQLVRISVYKDVMEDWKTRKEEFEKLDVRKMMYDPFDIIIKKAYALKEGEGFVLIQTFVPDPMINMLSEMGFEYEIDDKKEGESKVYFHKKKTDDEDDDLNYEKPAVTIQSATPVGYPIIMKLLQSKKIKKLVSIKELKVWEETEKHLGWIANKKADISFSSVITASKLKNSDVKMPIVFVWDNFSLLTRGYKANGLEDLKGKQISVPLFEDAPPAKITKHLIQGKGYDINDYKLVYGAPFGRPKQIMEDFIAGRVDTVLLREPEASFALKGIQEAGVTEFSELPYGELWNEVNNGFGLLPNAGVVFKGEFVREYPEIAKVIGEELEDAIKWLNNNKKDAAKLSFDMMRESIDYVESFLDRVTFEYSSGDELVEKVKDFYQILIDNEIINTEIDDALLDMFKL